MLSLQEAHAFLENKLSITNIEEKLKKNRFNLMREILYKFLHVEPFQNVINLSTRPEDRHLPSFQEIKEDMFGERGGRCYVANQFMKELLSTIGFDVFNCSCIVLKSGSNHVCLIVRHLTKAGDLHIIDVGLGHATWDPIPLDFQDESPVYHVGFLYFKFVRNGSVISRMHKHDKRYEFPGNIDSKAWHVFGEIDLTPREIDYFKPVCTAMYTIPGAHKSPFLEDLTLVKFENEKIIAIKNSTLLFENDNHQLEAEKIETFGELISVILDHFPNFSRDVIKAAIRSSPKCCNIFKM
ncbi:uncharacterized protein [Antedon mediterranea]|uniref:uncharacterized protein n=1 Tax=Antedon mediterranea TaxID=105859 RepID=UPI003AF814EF